MLRWGLLEVGGAVDAPVYAALRAAGHDLAVVASRRLTAAQAFAASHGVRRARSDYDDVLAADDVDAIYLALPVFLRARWVSAALEAGKHVLCRRPVATDAAGVGRAAAAAAAAGRVLAEAAPLRHHPAWQALAQAAAGGHLGDLRAVEVRCHRAAGADEADGASTERGGGALLDAGTDAVAVARWLVGEEPVSVAAVQRRHPGGADVATAALLGFPGGCSAFVDLSYDSAPADRIIVSGSSARAELVGGLLPWQGAPVELHLPDRAPQFFADDAYGPLVESFLAAARMARPLIGGDDAVATAGVVDRIRLAAG